MASRQKVDDAIVKAAQHHTDLNIFSAVITILEGGCVYTSHGRKTAERIISICKTAEQTHIRLYDARLKQAGVE